VAGALLAAPEFDPDAAFATFWMKFGTPVFDGKPLLWSESQWKEQVLHFVPDVVAGDWQLLTVPGK
jgi:hypothetical protein